MLTIMNAGLKNRGKTRSDVEERKKAMEVYSDTKFACVTSYTFDPLLAEKNVENMLGTVQLPHGFVGLVKINGDHAKGEFLAPMATTGFGTKLQHSLLVKAY